MEQLLLRLVFGDEAVFLFVALCLLARCFLENVPSHLEVTQEAKLVRI